MVCRLRRAHNYVYFAPYMKTQIDISIGILNENSIICIIYFNDFFPWSPPFFPTSITKSVLQKKSKKRKEKRNEIKGGKQPRANE